MFHIVFHQQADEEYLEAYSWYGWQKPGLEDRFALAINETLQKNAANPQYFGYIKKPFREAVVKIFPYVIVFTIEAKENAVVISSIFHASRNPKHKYLRIKK